MENSTQRVSARAISTKVISLILALAMILSIAPITVFAAGAYGTQGTGPDDNAVIKVIMTNPDKSSITTDESVTEYYSNTISSSVKFYDTMPSNFTIAFGQGSGINNITKTCFLDGKVGIYEDAAATTLAYAFTADDIADLGKNNAWPDASAGVSRVGRSFTFTVPASTLTKDKTYYLVIKGTGDEGGLTYPGAQTTSYLDKNIVFAFDVSESTTGIASVSLDNTDVAFDGLGKTLTLSASVLPAEADQTVTWSSSNTKVATVSAEGVVTPVGNGTCSIKATSIDTTVFAECSVKVYAGGSNRLFVATNNSTIDCEGVKAVVSPAVYEDVDNAGSYAIFDRFNTNSDATISLTYSGSGSGQAQYKLGVYDTPVTSTTDLSTMEAIASAGPSNAQTPLSVTVPADKLTDYSKTYYFVVEAGSKPTLSASPMTTNTVVEFYTIDDPTVHVTGFTLKNKSLVVSASGSNMVNPLPTITPSNADNKNIIWTSSDDSIAYTQFAVSTPSNTNFIKGRSPGTATITATTEDGGFTATCAVISVGVIPSQDTIDISVAGGDVAVPSYVTYPEGQDVRWTSLDESILKIAVDEHGDTVLRPSGKPGTVTIRAIMTYSGVQSITPITVNVLPVNVSSVALSKTTHETYPGNELILKETVLPENATNPAVTWTSSDENVATVDNTGKVTTLAVGTATITATTVDGGLTATCVVTVKEPQCETLGHTWMDATCTKPKTCEACHITEGDPLGHVEVVDSAVAPTKTEAGISEGLHCSRCNEILIAQNVLPALSKPVGFPYATNMENISITSIKVNDVDATVELNKDNQLVLKDYTPADKITFNLDSDRTTTKTQTYYYVSLYKDSISEANKLGRMCLTGASTRVTANEITNEYFTFVSKSGDNGVLSFSLASDKTFEDGIYFFVIEKDSKLPGGVLFTDDIVSKFVVGNPCEAGHFWEAATCTTPKMCAACGETEGAALSDKLTHTWTDATCTAPKMCPVCGETEGEALGHSWVDATCTAPKTCSTCHETDGEALPHTWVDATCTTPKTCSVCEATEGEALGHTLNSAGTVCTVCEERIALDAPVIKLTRVNGSSYFGKAKITWEAVAGATKYEVYRATSKDGSYTKLGTTTNLSYTNSGAPSGTTFYYKVKAISETEGVANSAFSSIKGFTTACDAPVVTLTRVSGTTSSGTKYYGKAKLTWEAVEGASKYEVYRATSKTGTYTLLGTTTKTSYTNSGAPSGKTYYYKVKAINGASSYAASDFSAIKGFTTACDAPTISIALSSNKPKLTWKAVTGASKYEIYRATSKSGSYTKIATTTSLSYRDANATKGKTYYYKIKAINGASTYAASAFSNIKSIASK